MGATIDSSSDASAAAVEMPVYRMPPPVETRVDPIAAFVQPFGRDGTAGIGRAIRSAVETTIGAIAAEIQTILDAVAASVCTFGATLARVVGKSLAGQQRQPHSQHNRFPIHGKSLLGRVF
jgi:hypothetical protein